MNQEKRRRTKPPEHKQQEEESDDFWGNHECEIYPEGQDTQSLWSSCRKNPGHTHFIAPKDFTMENLPETCRDEDLYKFIQLMSDLTVKITLSSVSPYRPEKFPGSRTKYPFSDLLGVKTQRSGTGKLLRVTLHPRRDQLKCKCQLCRNSNEPCDVWGEITVRTSTHVVFDTSECETAKLHVFYDDENQDTQNLESLDGVQVNYAGVDTDWCNLTCASHNMKLLLYLKYLEEEYLEVHKRIRDKYSNSEE